jgi:hypothetical protein
MSTFQRVRRSVTVWAAVIAAAGSVATGVIAQLGGDGGDKAGHRVCPMKCVWSW